jgi:predicted DCC family thiol-disulfide oxidoreductase YuxK
VAGTERIYYDGGCGFCHGWVRRVAERDRDGAFRFAPLGGETFLRRVPAERRAGLGDTVVLETEDGRLLVRSDAVIHALRRTGRGGAAGLLSALPRPLRDLGYRAFAAVRRAVAPRPDGACPVAAPELRARFDP